MYLVCSKHQGSPPDDQIHLSYDIFKFEFFMLLRRHDSGGARGWRQMRSKELICVRSPPYGMTPPLSFMLAPSPARHTMRAEGARRNVSAPTHGQIHFHTVMRLRPARTFNRTLLQAPTTECIASSLILFWPRAERAGVPIMLVSLAQFWQTSRQRVAKHRR